MSFVRFIPISHFLMVFQFLVFDFYCIEIWFCILTWYPQPHHTHSSFSGFFCRFLRIFSIDHVTSKGRAFYFFPICMPFFPPKPFPLLFALMPWPGYLLPCWIELVTAYLSASLLILGGSIQSFTMSRILVMCLLYMFFIRKFLPTPSFLRASYRK